MKLLKKIAYLIFGACFIFYIIGKTDWEEYALKSHSFIDFMILNSSYQGTSQGKALVKKMGDDVAVDYKNRTGIDLNKPIYDTLESNKNISNLEITTLTRTKIGTQLVLSFVYDNKTVKIPCIAVPMSALTNRPMKSEDEIYFSIWRGMLRVVGKSPDLASLNIKYPYSELASIYGMPIEHLRELNNLFKVAR